MWWLLMPLLFAETKNVEEIYVAPPTIHDPFLSPYQTYVNSMLVASANTNTHWVERTNRADQINIHDKHSIARVLDTTCDYRKPLVCGHENMHWVMITDIFSTENFATIIIKLYDENTNLIASTTKSSYSIESCKTPVKQTKIETQGKPSVEITETLPEKCVMLKPKIMARDLNQAVTIMFASIHPIK